MINFIQLGSDNGLSKRASLRILYRTYNKYLLVITVLFLAGLILSLYVVPELFRYVASISEANRYEKKVALLRSSATFIASIDDQKLDEQLRVASLALPIDKDYEGILNTIALSAETAGVSLRDYSFQVGELASGSAQTALSYSSLTTTLYIEGDIEKVTQFIKELLQRSPIAEVSSLQANNNSSSVKVDFYYMPIPTVRYTDATVVKPILDKDTQLLDQLK